MSYDIGDRRKLTCQIRNEAGQLADPEALFFQMRTPDGETTTYRYGTGTQVVSESTGLFRVHWDCTQSGFHGYRWVATGSIAAAEESSFLVNQSMFGALPA